MHSSYDAFALAVHVWALENNLQLISVNDTAYVSTDNDNAHNAQDEDTNEKPVVLAKTKWTQNSPNHYSFRYRLAPRRGEESVENSLEFTITKLGQNDVQITLVSTVGSNNKSGDKRETSGSTNSQQNEGHGKYLCFFVRYLAIGS